MDARDTRKERRKEQVRDEILEATRRVLLDRGVGGLTLAAVARRVQLTKAALYYYFPSKEALVFEMIYGSMASHAEAVGLAVDRADCGAAAIEALIRASYAHYNARMDELRLAYLVPQVGTAGASPFSPEMLARVRPFNDRIYGTTAEKIQADQRAGRIAKDIDGRRVAFLAQMAVIGMLTVEGVVEAADDAPLLHPQQDLVDELVRTFVARIQPPR